MSSAPLKFTFQSGVNIFDILENALPWIYEPISGVLFLAPLAFDIVFYPKLLQ